jgi:hypothetical protein
MLPSISAYMGVANSGLCVSSPELSIDLSVLTSSSCGYRFRVGVKKLFIAAFFFFDILEF